MRVFCDNYGCIFIDEYGFCDCDNLSIVGGVCEGSYHSGRNAGAERTCHNDNGWCDECEHFLHDGFSYCPWCGAKVVD